MMNLILSVLMRKGTNRRQGWLMLVAAAVMFANVGIWSIPTPESNLPVAPGSAD